MPRVVLLCTALASACSSAANNVALQGSMGALLGEDTMCETTPHGAQCTFKERPLRSPAEEPVVEDRDARSRRRPPPSEDELSEPPTVTPTVEIPKEPRPSESLWSVVAGAIKRAQTECKPPHTSKAFGDVRVRVNLSVDSAGQVTVDELLLEPRSPGAAAPTLQRPSRPEPVPRNQDPRLPACIAPILRDIVAPSGTAPGRVSFEFYLVDQPASDP